MTVYNKKQSWRPDPRPRDKTASSTVHAASCEMLGLLNIQHLHYFQSLL